MEEAVINVLKLSKSRSRKPTPVYRKQLLQLTTIWDISYFLKQITISPVKNPGGHTQVCK
jgi:hypothetical protein